MKNSVTQIDEYGCSVACVAFLLNKNYEETLKLFSNSEKAKDEGFICKEIVSVLKSNGINAEYKYLKPYPQEKIISDNTIVFVKRTRKYPFGHFLIRYNSEWMDPWVNFPENKDIKKAKSGFRNDLPDKAIYGIFIVNNNKNNL